jgi:hypothetical protein
MKKAPAHFHFPSLTKSIERITKRLVRHSYWPSWEVYQMLAGAAKTIMDATQLVDFPIRIVVKTSQNVRANFTQKKPMPNFPKKEKKRRVNGG